MEIQGNITLGMDTYGVSGLERSPSARADAKAPPAEEEARKGDTVTVSQDALLLTEARRTAQNTPDVRAEKVESLRIQVANGTYRPDSRLIAENLVREEPWLFTL